MRSAAGVLEADELPITDYDAPNVSDAVAATKELTTPADVRAILARTKAARASFPPHKHTSRPLHKRSRASTEPASA